MDIEKLCSFAVRNGCINAVPVERKQVATDIRTIVKCHYGCPSYGISKMCPPYSMPPERFYPILKKYRAGIVVETKASDINSAVVAVEKEAVRLGYHFAFGMRGGACPLCPECTPAVEPCRKPLEARPSMEALGIDVFRTLLKAGIKHKKLASSDDDFNFFGLILID